MTLGRKGLTSGAIKELTVCCVCFMLCAILLGRHAALYRSVVQRDTKQHVQVSPLPALSMIAECRPG
ncbi:unnamed protein product, partial [Staurois parvus]